MRFIVMSAALVLVPIAGCLPHKTPPAPPPPVVVAPPPEETLESHVVGVWRLSEKGTKPGRMIFDQDGTVRFAGALENLGTGAWSLDTTAGELRVTLPQASNEDLSIFKMYVGQGVRRFSRPAKEIVYAFDDATQELLIAGWTYRKESAAAVRTEAEPVLK